MFIILVVGFQKLWYETITRYENTQKLCSHIARTSKLLFMTLAPFMYEVNKTRILLFTFL